MKEVDVSESVTSLVDAKKIIDSLETINKKIGESELTAENLVKNVSDSSKSLQKAKDNDSVRRRLLGWSSETLLDFIIESNNATHSSVSSISKLIQNSNENSRLLAEMMGKLAMLSGLSFEKISETTAQLEEIAQHFEESSSSAKGQAGQLNRFFLAYINKIRDEKNNADRIEFNFSVINENLKQLDQKLDRIKDESQRKAAEIEGLLDAMRTEADRKILALQQQLSAKPVPEPIDDKDSIALPAEYSNAFSAEHLINMQKKQKALLIYLAALSAFTFLVLAGFLILYFSS